MAQSTQRSGFPRPSICNTPIAERRHSAHAGRHIRKITRKVSLRRDANWRRRGIGSALLESGTRWAEQASVATLRMVGSRNNWPMRQLAHKVGARLDFDLDEIFADIAVATAASLDAA